MSDTHVRARCEATGHVAALPAHAFRLGVFPGWVLAEGPVPTRAKTAVRRRRSRRDTADAASAENNEE
ncbi:hypothetical protein FHX69_2613 [Prauserella muralis]|nr:hypothetical protein FHX69_2613 [Prauserella muralis]